MIKTQQLPKRVFYFNSHSSEPIGLDMSTPHVMGILNVTPDSFSDGGKFNQLDLALSRVKMMMDEGVSIIDIGGESTRPNAMPVGLEQEKVRVLPVVEAIAKRFDVIISIDTSSPEVMHEAFHLGARIWNDVRGLRRPGAAKLAAKLDIPVMLMHTRGEPDNMMQFAKYNSVVDDVKTELISLAQAAIDAGVKKNNIILDVGFGFAKTHEQNYELLANLSQFSQLGFVQMVGMSKKRMLAEALANIKLSCNVDERVEAGLTAAILSVLQGVSIIRTHDVLATKRALSVFEAMRMRV